MRCVPPGLRWPALRRAGVALTTGFAVGCGGGSPTAVTPPPPPPPPGAASVTISAGDQQQAAGGAPVAVAPAVLVRNTQGQPVSGVTVQFSVVEGGGALDGTAPVTDVSGVARVTSWTLGPSGTQRVQAQVGTIAPVVFQATLIPGTEEITVTLGGNGGTHQITTPGHPYQGLTLTIPAGTYAGGSTVQMRVVPNPTLPALPAGYRVSGPVLEVYTPQGRGAHLMTLDVPVTRAANEEVLIAFRDPVRGVTEVMPTVGRTATTVRVATTHLRPDFLLGPGLVAAARTMPGPQAQIPAGQSGWLYPIAVPVPMPPVAPVINPATDRWPVIDHGSARFPDGHGVAIPALVTLNASMGGPPFSQQVKALKTPGLYAESAPIAVVIKSRQELLGAFNTWLAEYQALVAAMPKAMRDEMIHHNIIGGLGISVNPTTLALIPSVPAATPVFANGVAGSETSLSLLGPASDALTDILRDQGIGYQAMTVPQTPDQPPVTIDAVVPLPSFMIDYQALWGQLFQMQQALAQAVGATRESANQQMAAAAGLPTPVVEMEAVPGGGWVPAVNHELVVRSPEARIRLAGPGAGTGDEVVVSPWARYSEEELRANPLSLFPKDFHGFPAAPDGGPPVDYILAWNAKYLTLFRQMTSAFISLVPARYRVTPETLELPADRKVDFNASVPAPPATGFRIKWEWGDGTTSEQFGLTTATHTYTVADDYEVISTLMANTPGREVLGVDTVEVTGAAAPFWRITSITDQDTLYEDDLQGGNDLALLLERVLAVPTSGAITVEESGGTTELRLRVLRTATWNPAQCCPLPPFNSGTELQLRLGVTPPQLHQVGPYFAGWGSSFWTETTQDLGTGTMTGQDVLGIQVYEIKDAGTQTGPGGGIRFTASRNGTTMTGIISFTVWYTDDTSGEVDTPPSVYRLPFTATRMK